jgi:hypothetical protein
LKVRLSRVQNGETFWLGWGRMKSIGHGLRLEEQSEDTQGGSTYLPVYSQNNNPLVGQLTIPTALIFQPLQPPVGVVPNLVLSFEDVQLAIIRGLAHT